MNIPAEKRLSRTKLAGRLRRKGLLVLVGFVALSIAIVAVYRATRWKRFAVVETGRIYRSGQLTQSQMEAAIAKLRLKTVICLNPESLASDSAACQRLGANFRPFKMPSDGVADAKDLAAAVALLADPRNQPVLVHCQAGVARTGACVALYRMMHQGWPAERALEELRSFERRGRLEPRLRDHVIAVGESLHSFR